MRCALVTASLLALAAGCSEPATASSDAERLARYVELEGQMEALRARTDPAQWSAHGWRSLRWGMGPADVAERMSGSLVDALATTRPVGGDNSFYTLRSLLREKIYGREIRISFQFSSLDNRLQGVSMGPKYQPEDLTTVSWWGRCKDWGTSVRRGLREKYGTPACGPDCWRTSGAVVGFSFEVSPIEEDPPYCLAFVFYSDPEVVAAKDAAEATRLTAERAKL